MNNPFVFGDFVSDDAFCDREEELEFLCRDLGDFQKIFLISPRRYGKTSLLKKVLLTLEKDGWIVAYVDLYRASSLQMLLDVYCGAVARAAESSIDRAVRFIGDVLPRLRPKITLDVGGAPSIGIEPVVSDKELMKALDDTFELPARLAEQKKKRVAVVFDEFQEIAKFDGDALEKLMRSHIQGHHGVGYVFSGSKRHMMEEMVLNEERAFYKLGKVSYLGKIPRVAFLPFLRGCFEKSGFKVESGAVERALDIASEIPYNAQYLCHEIWDRRHDERLVRKEDVDDVFSKILDEQTPFFVEHWDGLTLIQRSVLKCLSLHESANPYSREFLMASGVRALSTMQTTIKLLIKKGIIEKSNGGYAVSDVFYREWIRRKM